MIKVFSRLAWRKVDGEFVPASDARKTHVCYCETVEEARDICKGGPAQQAMAQGREYRHLSFYEFTGEAS